MLYNLAICRDPSTTFQSYGADAKDAEMFILILKIIKPLGRRPFYPDDPVNPV